jgi:hypothetical protein
VGLAKIRPVVGQCPTVHREVRSAEGARQDNLATTLEFLCPSLFLLKVAFFAPAQRLGTRFHILLGCCVGVIWRFATSYRPAGIRARRRSREDPTRKASTHKNTRRAGHAKPWEWDSLQQTERPARSQQALEMPSLNSQMARRSGPTLPKASAPTRHRPWLSRQAQPPSRT